MSAAGTRNRRSRITGRERLPKPQSDLARESLKDPYRFDFLGLTDEAQERAIESTLVQHVTQFLLELGAGFAFVGRQVLLDVGGDEFFIDLLFYHLKLRCYVVIELKAGKFKPEHLGQLRDNAQPLGIAEYKLLDALPEPLRTSLPTIEQIENELRDIPE